MLWLYFFFWFFPLEHTIKLSIELMCKKSQSFHSGFWLTLKMTELFWWLTHLLWLQIPLLHVLCSVLLTILHTSLCSFMSTPSSLYWLLLLTNTVGGYITLLVINYWHMHPYTIMKWVFLDSCASDLKPVKIKDNEVVRTNIKNTVYCLHNAEINWWRYW